MALIPSQERTFQLGHVLFGEWGAVRVNVFQCFFGVGPFLFCLGNDTVVELLW